ncbi:MAG: fructoselysine 6-kinase [Halanaerobiales bacterium]|nr:fructoselysine 6-kinase [Halanaerobiales bacterium]
MDLICIGDNVADYYLERGELYPGGSAYNVAVLARRYGMKTAYMGPMGNDPAGRYLYQVLSEEGVDISRVEIKEGPNAFSRVRIESGERIIFGVDKGVYREIVLNREDLKYVKGFDLLHTTTYSFTEDYLSIFKEMGLMVSFDYSFRCNRDYIERTAPNIDFAFFSASGIRENYGSDQDYSFFMKEVNGLGPAFVFITLGEEGVLLLHQDQLYYQPAFKVEVVDTLGAGDAFIAMFLSCYSKGLGITTSMEKASKVAGEVCTYFGAIGRGRAVRCDKRADISK